MNSDTLKKLQKEINKIQKKSNEIKIDQDYHDLDTDEKGYLNENSY